MRIGVRIVRGQVHEHADTPHPLGLLRPRHQRRALFGLAPGALDQHLGRGGEGVELIGEPIHA